MAHLRVLWDGVRYDQYDDPAYGMTRAQTVFMRLSPDYASFVEEGTRSFASDPGRFRIFFEYRDYPGGAVATEGSGRYSDSQYMSLFVAPYSDYNYTWKGGYHLGSSQSNWTVFGVSPSMVANSGLAESEVALFGNSSARTYHTSLKYRPATGGWFNWTSLQCDPNVINVSDWDANKLSNTAWRTDQQSPPPGDC